MGRVFGNFLLLAGVVGRFFGEILLARSGPFDFWKSWTHRSARRKSDSNETITQNQERFFRSVEKEGGKDENGANPFTGRIGSSSICVRPGLLIVADPVECRLIQVDVFLGTWLP